MFSLRLDKDTEKKIYEISLNENVSKSDVVKEALEQYIVGYEKRANPYSIGKDLFGKHSSGESDGSVNYKEKVKQKINEKMSD